MKKKTPMSGLVSFAVFIITGIDVQRRIDAAHTLCTVMLIFEIAHL
jgi:hypothetical protein